MITDFPFRVIPRTVDTKILKIKDGESNTKNAGSTPISNHRNRSKNETRSSQQQQPNIDVIMKHAAKGFVDDQTQVTSTYRTKLAAFGVPLPIEIATLHNKYYIFEVAASDEDIRNIDVTPISARVRNKTTCVEYTARMQGRMKSVANAKILDLDGERKFLASISTSQSKKENSLISRLLDSGFDSDFRYIIVEDAGRDLKTLLDHYKYFEPPTVFLITYYSFQAIKELHSYGYYHMDLRLSSFSISPTFNLKIVEFFRVTSSKSTCKVSHKFRLDRFVSRKYHKQGAIFDAFDDYENWLFVIMFIFCESKLPWKHNGKNGFLESKEAFFKRRDDYNWCGSTDSLILIPYLMEKKTNISEFIEAVDELFSIDVMGFEETTLPDWGTSMNEVSRKLKKTRKAV
ncbi:unnamed protein product [Caenorhabditis angaria]|uniref:Protein kinase domain-containing protein n=1 Tax=Caenorhabditis angaria TaxID=860376 RepID=A0A9P1N461_9PELO|nr:unnamed protein product [Caenorhabditis angaria]CAI5449229.1 unnamed protein product [Caenorhabditis angaria]